MLYCGPDMCNCSARWFYEAEEDEDWSIADKKAHAESKAYKKYLQKLQASRLSGCQVAEAGQSRVTYISSADAIVSVLK